MDSAQLKYLAKLRVAVGYLGERDQYAWWQSSFFSTGSQAFLAPIFARTQFLAQCSGVTRAAARVHDERIGTGHVYHLFRLPEDMEQDLHQLLHSPDLTHDITAFVGSKETAVNFLQQTTEPLTTTPVGPALISNVGALRDLTKWRMACAHYSYGFSQGITIFPYFGDYA